MACAAGIYAVGGTFELEYAGHLDSSASTVLSLLALVCAALTEYPADGSVRSLSQRPILFTGSSNMPVFVLAGNVLGTWVIFSPTGISLALARLVECCSLAVLTQGALVKVCTCL